MDLLAGTSPSDRGTPLIFGDLSPSRLHTIVGTPDACVAASTTPLGRAIEVEGGYRLSGRLAWAS
jgi:hypothetical protein